MKYFKTTASIIVLFLILAPIILFAKNIQKGQTGIHEPGTGIENPEIKEAGQGEVQEIEVQNNIDGLQNQLEEQQQNTQNLEEIINPNIEGNKINNEEKGKGYNQANDKATQRRSMVANAIHGMLEVAERNKGVGEQIRVIAQAQNQNQEKIEAEIKEVKNRGRLKKFFFGPDYKKLNSVEDRIVNHEQKLEELKQVATQITNKVDATKLQEQIKIMEQVKTELENEVIKENKGFSLFGWLNKMLSK